MLGAGTNAAVAVIGRSFLDRADEQGIQGPPEELLSRTNPQRLALA